MKKFFSFLATTLLLGLTACEDVPAPYGINNLPGEEPGPSTVLLDASFTTSLKPFTSYTTSGDGAWKIDYSAATATGYDHSTQVTTAGTYYLVSPEVEVAAEATHISFEYVLKFMRAAENQQLLITDNFDENNPEANWTLLAQIDTETENYTDFRTIDVQVPESYQGKKTRIAFRYSCDGTSASTLEIKNVKWQKGTAQGGGGDEPQPGGEAKTLFSEDFSGGQGGFTFHNIVMNSPVSYIWKATSYNSKYYLIASAFVSGASYASESWAISPAINLSDSKTATLNFQHAINKLDPSDRKTDMMTVWVSTDFDGSNVKGATWTQVTIPNYPDGNANWNFVDAGNMDLTPFCGKEKVYIGLRYTSEDGISGSWEVNNFIVTGDGTPTTGGNTGGNTGGTTGGNTGGNTGGSTGDTGTAEGAGTETSPYNVAALFANYVAGQAAAATVQGYIVGYVDGKTYTNGCRFNLTDGTTVSTTNLLLADSPTETDPTKCVPVQLPAGDVRSALNLNENPGNLGKLVVLTGSIEKYFSVAGLKSVTAYKFN